MKFYLKRRFEPTPAEPFLSRDKMTFVRTLSEAEVRSHLEPAKLIANLELAFRDRYSDLEVPLRTQMTLPDGIFLIMPCYDRKGNALGMKLVAVQSKADHQTQRIAATYLLLDPITATPRLILPAGHLTEIRTAATSALATKFLSRPDAQALGIFGTGRQARAHLEVLPLVRKFNHALVCGRDPDRSREFAREMSTLCDFPIEAVDAATCAANSDVLCTCTNSSSPLFDGHLLRPGTHLNLVGTFQPHAREVDSHTIANSTVVVETFSAVLAEAGDILIPISEGVINRDHIKMDLHQLTKSDRPYQTRDEITLFKSVGCALEDLVAAKQIEASLP